MRFLVPLVAALVPLLIAPGWVSHFDVTPKIGVLLLGTALLLTYRSANVQNVYNLLRQPAGHWLAAIMGATWVCAALATLLSTHPWLSLNGSGWRRMGLIPETALLLFVLFTAGWLAADRGNVRILLRACVASGALAAVYGAAQYFGWDPLLPVSAYQVGEGQYQIVRPPGTLGHADYFAAWMVAIVFLALALENLETERWLKIAAGAASALAALAIVLSGTRSAMLGAVAGGVVLVLLIRPGMRRRPAIAAAAGLALLALLFISPAGLKLRARLHWSLEDARGGARLLLWRDSLAMAVRRPITGYGPETFATEFPRFQSAELARAFPDFYHESPHNMFLDTLVSGGLAGFFVLLWLCGLGAWCALRSVKRGQPAAGPLAGALIGLLVAQQFIVFILPLLLYFLLIVATLAAGAPAEHESAPDTASPSALVLIASVAVVVIFAVYSLRLLAADRFLAVAELDISRGDVRGASVAYQRVLQWHLPGTGGDLAYSRAMQRLASSSHDMLTSIFARREALEAGARAVTTAEDRQNAWYSLAALRASGNDASGVEQALRQSIACAPNWFKPRWMLAQVLTMTHHPAEALTEATAAVQLDGGHDPEVLATWKSLQTKPNRGP